jgi:serine O-acetyltransferase
MLLRLHSLARWCQLHQVPVVPRLIKSIVYVVFGCVIPPEVSIGSGTCLHHHGLGIIVHESVEIGSNCNIYNHVVIGGGHDGPDGPPIRIFINDGVTISAGAKVLCKSGTLTIGAGSTVAANAVVLSDVPPNCVAVGMPARCLPKKRPVVA